MESSRRRRSENETIVALSSAPGRARRAVIRLSGARAVPVVDDIFRADDDVSLQRRDANTLTLGCLRIEAFVAPVPCMVALMRAPRSYTREDVVELHVPASPAITSAVVAAFTGRGVRMARPGEFTERAYLSGRIDLAQAEAVLKIIHAHDDAERRAAVGELEGALSKRVGALDDRLLEVLIQSELALDFSEDEIPVVEPSALRDELARMIEGIDALIAEGVANIVFSETPRVSLIGRANVGKSSLFNRLVGRGAAIVTPIPGTTRDVLEEEIVVSSSSTLPPAEGREVASDEVPPPADVSTSPAEPVACRLKTETCRILLVDTAGEKVAEEDLDLEALRRAREELERAELVVLVIDASAQPEPVDLTLMESLRERAAVVVLNKIDLAVDEDVVRLAEGRLECPVPAMPVRASCATGEGIDILRREIVETLTRSASEGTSRSFLLNLRQRDALVAARDALVRADGALREGIGLEFAAAEMRLALNRLRELTRPLEEDEILDRIFSRFCIGK